jgi:hypothetical protein
VSSTRAEVINILVEVRGDRSLTALLVALKVLRITVDLLARGKYYTPGSSLGIWPVPVALEVKRFGRQPGVVDPSIRRLFYDEHKAGEFFGASGDRVASGATGDE